MTFDVADFFVEVLSRTASGRLFSSTRGAGDTPSSVLRYDMYHFQMQARSRIASVCRASFLLLILTSVFRATFAKSYERVATTAIAASAAKVAEVLHAMCVELALQDAVRPV
jgi:hypothetical protein